MKGLFYVQHRLSNKNLEAMTADCKACGPDTPLFYRKHRDQWVCRKKWNENANRIQPTYRSRKRGMEIDSYEEVWDFHYKKQNGLCAICEEPLGKTAAMDHDHVTGRVRGLLCFSDNVAIGHMKDDVERLQKAIDYLRFR